VARPLISDAYCRLYAIAGTETTKQPAELARGRGAIGVERSLRHLRLTMRLLPQQAHEDMGRGVTQLVRPPQGGHDPTPLIQPSRVVRWRQGPDQLVEQAAHGRRSVDRLEEDHDGMLSVFGVELVEIMGQCSPGGRRL
jgi:hypothetical protein